MQWHCDCTSSLHVTLTLELRRNLKAAARCAFTVLLCGPALGQTPKPPEIRQPSSYVNRETPAWLSVGAVYRFRIEGRSGIGFEPGRQDAYGLSRLLVHVGIQPKPWLKVFVQGQDARAPGKQDATPFFRDPMDLRQAYVELGEIERGWLRVRAGRQDLLYGAQRLIGPLDWSNTARQFDAVKLTVGKKDMSMDVFSASVVRIDDTAFNRSRSGENLHGLYGGLNKLFPNTTFEPYLLWKTQPATGSLTVRDADVYTAGFRLLRPLPAGFDTAVELARQFGHFGPQDVSAWGAYGILGYTPPALKLSPRFSVEYTYGSGNRNPADPTVRTFDQLFPTGHLYLGVADLVGWRNIKAARGGVELKPHAKLQLAVDVFSFWLASPQDHLYNAGGRIAARAPEGGVRDTHVGEELDITLVYKPAPYLTVGAGFGYLFPGKFLKRNTPGSATSFPYLFCNYVL